MSQEDNKKSKELEEANQTLPEKKNIDSLMDTLLATYRLLIDDDKKFSKFLKDINHQIKKDNKPGSIDKFFLERNILIKDTIMNLDLTADNRSDWIFLIEDKNLGFLKEKVGIDLKEPQIAHKLERLREIRREAYARFEKLSKEAESNPDFNMNHVREIILVTSSSSLDFLQKPYLIDYYNRRSKGEEEIV